MVSGIWDTLVTRLLDWIGGRANDAPREERLRELLTNLPEGVEWRSMKTLSRSIGADE